MSDLANYFRVLACQRSREPAEADGGGGVHRCRHVRDAGVDGAGGLQRSRGGFMLVMHGDGVLTCGRHVRGAAGASDGRQRQPRSHLESWWPFIAAKIA